ncbi:amino acid ABC transporter substrate-binding protein, PAAT family [Duganella sp. CF458]|uniref:substrate-binding periplasmic protein n=1 Tax=Duganella sp. CF458 TaxID=1884368 RepID=UPI0008E2C280|nr:transporter substrate-binding domain-containing protein [Duganella sp. CF458]SFG04086.1 amino acid ABC transporter substrate-binding protein, PAAT family [Duganella sp. CF458]
MQLRRILLALAACLAGSTAAASCGPYTVAMYEHGALYYRSGEQWAGIDKDIVDELARRTGCALRMTRDSRIRIWTMLKDGALDMTMSGIATPEREGFARFTPYLQSRNMLLVRNEAARHATTLEQFAAQPELKVAVIKGFKHGATYDAWLDRLRKQGRVHDTPDYSTLLRLFQYGRVHAILQLSSNVDALYRDAQVRGQFRVLDLVPRENVQGALVISRLVADDSAARLEQALRAMREDGTVKTIMERHTSPERALAMVLR